MTVPARRRARMAMLRMWCSLKSASFYPDLGREAPVKLVQPVLAEAVHFVERGGGRREERLDVDALAARRERREIALAARQHVHGAVVIELAQVMEGDANLQDPLIEVPDVAGFGAP